MTKAEKTRQFIIEKSAIIINKKGVAGTSISDLMEATQLAKGGIYGNFESKEEICMEAFQYLVGNVTKAIDKALATKTSAKEKLFTMLEFYQNNIAKNDLGGCPLLSFGVEADDTNPFIRQRVAKAVKVSQKRFASLIEEGKASGEFDKKVDSDLQALKIFAMIQGGMFTTRVTNSHDAIKTIVTLLKKDIEAF